jgi:hypothetical protein
LQILWILNSLRVRGTTALKKQITFVVGTAIYHYKKIGADSAKKSAGLQPRKGLEGCEAAPMRSVGAGALAEPRKARFPAGSAGNAPKFF